MKLSPDNTTEPGPGLGEPEKEKSEKSEDDGLQEEHRSSTDQDDLGRTRSHATTHIDNGAGENSVVHTGTNNQDQPLYSIFSPHMRRFIIIMTVFATLFSPISSFIYLPVLTPLAEAYHRSIADINLTVTVYQIIQATAPLLFGDLSDQIGRRPVYMITFSLYLAANIGLALQKSYVALMVLRALQSAGSSATVAIASGIVGDLTTSAERGGYIAAVQGSVLFAPAISPLLGGVLSQYLGWRSVFWFLVISTVVFLLAYMPLVPETGRNVVGNGSIPPPVLNSSLLSSRLRPYGGRKNDAEANVSRTTTRDNEKKDKKFKIPVPNIWAAIVIAFEKDVGLLLLFISIVVMANFSMLIPLQDVMRRNYHLDDLQVGLCYMPFAVGSLIGILSNGKLLNWYYARVAKSIGMSPDRKKGDDLRKFPIEKARLKLVWPGLFLASASMVAYGWVVDSGVHLSVPLIVLFFGGLGLGGPQSSTATLIVDLYPMSPGRVSSTFNLTRGGFSAVGTAVIQYIIDAWGYGYTYLFLGLLMLSTSPAIWAVLRWGPKWREERYQRFEKAEEKRKQKRQQQHS